MDDLPIHPGTYALIIRLDDSVPLAVGNLGEFVFSSGIFIYLGSAHGPGGIRGRLGRHLRGGGRSHWHIDYFLGVGKIQGYGMIESIITEPILPPVECQWAQYLSDQNDAKIPASGFGASDCKSCCQSHLIQFPEMDVAHYLSGFIEGADTAGWFEPGVFTYRDLQSGQTFSL